MASPEKAEEARLAVGLALLLLEGALGEGPEAEGTDEVLGVEALGHGGDAAAGDGFPAAPAQRAPPGVEVPLAVGVAAVLEEAAPNKGREALLGTGTRGWGHQGPGEVGMQDVKCSWRWDTGMWGYQGPGEVGHGDIRDLGRWGQGWGWGSHPADEALGVPEPLQGGDVALQDGPPAAPAPAGEELGEVLAAVLLAILLQEA